MRVRIPSAPRERLEDGHRRAIELLDDALHVGAGFAVGRDAAMLDDRDLAGVVGREDERKIVAEYVDHRAKVSDAGFDVRPWIEGIVDAQARRGLGHELHQASRATSRDGARVPDDSASMTAATRSAGTS